MNIETAKLAAERHPDKIIAPFEHLYKRLGFDGVSTLCELYGGGNIYVPSMKRMFSRCIYEEIRNEPPDTDIRYIVNKYGLCERTVRMVLFEQDTRSKNQGQRT